MALTALEQFGDMDLARGEKIIFRAHSHWLVFARDAFPGFLGIAVAILLLWAFATFFDLRIRDGLDASTFFLFLAGFPLLWGIYVIIRRYIDWQYDQIIISNKRVIFLDHTFLFSRQLASADYESIRDITVHQHGFIRHVFRVGTLDVKTSAVDNITEGTRLIIHDVHHPRRLHKLLDMLINTPELRDKDPDELLIECGLKRISDVGKDLRREIQKILG